MRLGETRFQSKPHPLAKARARRGLSQRTLARRVQMSVGGLSHIESGKSDPHRSTKLLLEKELGFKINWPNAQRRAELRNPTGGHDGR